LFYSPKFTRKYGQKIALSADQIILGQAPSTLDSEVESELQQSLTDVMQNKMVIAIKH